MGRGGGDGVRPRGTATEQAEPGYTLPAPVLDAARAMLDLCAEG